MKTVSVTLQVIPSSITGCLRVLGHHHGSLIVSQFVIFLIAFDACESSSLTIYTYVHVYNWLPVSLYMFRRENTVPALIKTQFALVCMVIF